jgi:hypothetical protein
MWISPVLFLCLCAVSSFAQNSGGQDTSFGGPLRPRRETYIVETYPSPARANQTINITYYNHNPEETSLRIVDINDKVVIELQPRQFVTNGLHYSTVPSRKLPSGTYFVRLTSYTSTGSKKQVQDSRFIVVH